MGGLLGFWRPEGMTPPPASNTSRTVCPCLLYLVWPQHFCVIRKARRGHQLGPLPTEYQLPGSLGKGRESRGGEEP